MSDEMASAPPRRRGRPPATDQEREATRERIIAGTAVVFAEFGYHGVTVARILEASGISKSHYYAYFRNSEEPVQIVLDRYADGLVEALAMPLRRSGSTAEERLLGALEAYLRYASDRRRVMASYTASLHDPSAPVELTRLRAWQRISDLIRSMFTEVERSEPRPLEIDAFLTCAEFICFRLVRDEDLPEPAATNLGRSAMIRAAVALLGDRSSWNRALEVPGLVPESRLLT